MGFCSSPTVSQAAASECPPVIPAEDQTQVATGESNNYDAVFCGWNFVELHDCIHTLTYIRTHTHTHTQVLMQTPW